MLSGYQTKSPSDVVAPCQIKRATVATVSVIIVLLFDDGQMYSFPMTVAGSKEHSLGRDMIPSSRPSRLSQDWMAAALMASSSHGVGKPYKHQQGHPNISMGHIPFSFMTTCGQKSCSIN